MFSFTMGISAQLGASILLAGLCWATAADYAPGNKMLSTGQNSKHLWSEVHPLLREIRLDNLRDLPFILSEANERLGPLVITGLGDEFAQSVLAFKTQAPFCLERLLLAESVKARAMADGSTRLTFALNGDSSSTHVCTVRFAQSLACEHSVPARNRA